MLAKNVSASIAPWLDAAGRRKATEKGQTLKVLRAMARNKPGSKAYINLMNKACEMNLLLVASFVKSFASNKPAIIWKDGQAEDLLQQGYFGLRRAVEKFDSSKGYEFSTYAMPWIRQAVTRYHNSRSTAIYIPEGVHRQLFHVAKYGFKKKMPSLTMNDRLLAAAQCAINPVRLDAPIGEDGATLFHETVAYKKPEPSYSADEDNWATKVLDDALKVSDLNELETNLVKAYSKCGNLATACRRCGIGEHTGRPVLRGAIKRLQSSALT